MHNLHSSIELMWNKRTYLRHSRCAVIPSYWSDKHERALGAARIGYHRVLNLIRITDADVGLARNIP